MSKDSKEAKAKKKAMKKKVTMRESFKIYMQNTSKKKLVKKIAIGIILYLVLFDLAFVFIYPFLTMILDAFKSDADLLNSTVKWIPTELTFVNFKLAYSELHYLDYLKNSLITCTVATLGHAIVCSFIGYGFARYKFRGKGVLFAGVILSMLVPTQVIVFPLYQMYAGVGFLDTYLPILVPCFFGFGLRGAFYIFLFRQFFMGLPYEMEEAARIDGCGPLRTYIKIMLPMSRSSLLVCAVLSVVWHWNESFEQSIYLNSAPQLQLLTAKIPDMYEKLAQFSEEAVEGVNAAELVINQGTVMAATFLVILPLLVIYMFVQKQFMEGVERSGLTGM